MMYCAQLASEAHRRIVEATQQTAAVRERETVDDRLHGFSPAYRAALSTQTRAFEMLNAFSGAALIHAPGDVARLGALCQAHALLRGWRALPYDSARHYQQVLPTERQGTALHRTLFPACWGQGGAA